MSDHYHNNVCESPIPLGISGLAHAKKIKVFVIKVYLKDFILILHLRHIQLKIY